MSTSDAIADSIGISNADCMAEESAINDILDAAAVAPAEVEGDAGRVKAQSLPDLIKYADRAAAKEAAAQTNRGIRITRLAPGDAT